jgi:uncharacterized membrane protein YeiB
MTAAAPAPTRILGLDYARAFAIFGMVGAHLGNAPAFVLTDPSTWDGIIHGNSSILFGLLAGVSIAIMTGGPRIPQPHELPTLRLRLLGRGGVIFAIGLLLELLGTSVAIILTFYGLLYLLVLPVLRMRPAALVALAVGIGLVGPAVVSTIYSLGYLIYAPGFDMLFGGMYPLTTWLPLLLLGLALGRVNFTKTINAITMLVFGFGVWLLSQGLGMLLTPVIEDVELTTGGTTATMLRALADITPHGGGTLELVGSGAFAFALLGFCLLIPRAAATVLRPLSAVGAMPLTTYTGHLIALALIWPGGELPYSNAVWGITVVIMLVVCPIWLRYARRGPLEQVAAHVGLLAAGQRLVARPAVVAATETPSGGAPSEEDAPPPVRE